MSNDIDARVNRERTAHEEDDVLGRNAAIKNAHFGHTVENRFFKQFEKNFDDLIQGTVGTVLEIGCGPGEKAVMLARRGLRVEGIDISAPYIDSARALAASAGVADRCNFQVMDCHSLAFADSQFDLVFGKAILHHLDLHVVMSQINRVLKPGGHAIFVEPLAANPLLKLFRLLTPKARTVDEMPLTRADLDRFQDQWDVRSQYYGIWVSAVAAFTSICRLRNPDNLLVEIAGHTEALTAKISPLHAFNQHVLLNLVKRER